jgi:hypothetical protein
MSNHFSADNLKFPGDDRRLDFTDLFRVQLPAGSGYDGDHHRLDPTSAPPPIPAPTTGPEFYPALSTGSTSTPTATPTPTSRLP